MNRMQRALLVAGCLLASVPLAAQDEAGAAAARASSLHVEYRADTLGCDVPRPRLSWVTVTDARGWKQSAYQILVATAPGLLTEGQADAWDSGKVTSDAQNQIEYAGKALQSRTRYAWKVRLWDAQGQPTPWSDAAWWETGLLAPADWKARWVTIADPATPANPPLAAKRSLCFRKEFRLAEKPARARAYVSGLGCYVLYLNGQRVGRDLFDPGWTNFKLCTQYQTYDVTDMLSAGDNALAAVCGGGWWSGMGGGGAKRRLLLQLEGDDARGQRTTVVTDDSWKCLPSPVVEDSFYHGENYDARLYLPGWDKAGFDAKAWAPAAVLPDPLDNLLAQQCQTLQVTEELKAVSVKEPVKGKWVFDFGQNAAGVCRLKVRAPAGTPIQIRHAEVLNPDGTLYTANYRGARATDTYTCRGEGEEVWEPQFTYRGFRYAELSGCPEPPGADALVFRVIHTAAPVTGRFECSNELLNRVQKAIVWGQRSNIYAVPTDCPQRNERLGWTGDAQTFTPTACWNMDMSLYLAKYVRDMIRGGGGGLVAGGGPGWEDAKCVIPWALYHFYADRRLLESSYPMMAALVRARQVKAPKYLLEQDGYGDWVAAQGSPKKPIGAAYYYRSIKIAADAAAVLGKTEEAKQFEDLARQVAAAFDAAYRSAEKNTYPGDTQAAMVIPLCFGLVPEAAKPAVVANLVKNVADRGDHLSTGFLGTGCLLPALSDAGQHELAYRVAAQKTYPSWGYMVENGGTTIWELWNSDKAGPGMNSRNHFALGTCGEWYFQYLAGLGIGEPGFRHVVIRPRPAGDLTWVKAAYESLRGPIVVEWKREGGALALDVKIPANTTATVWIPAASADEVTEGGKPASQAQGVKFVKAAEGAAIFEVGAGTYQFRAARR